MYASIVRPLLCLTTPLHRRELVAASGGGHQPVAVGAGLAANQHGIVVEDGRPEILNRRLVQPDREGISPGRAIGRAAEVERERSLVAELVQAAEECLKVNQTLAWQEVLLVLAVGVVQPDVA